MTPASTGGGEQGRTVVVDGREDHHRRARDDQLGEQLAPPAPGLGDDRLSVELEQIEGDVRDRTLAALEQCEARDPALVERAELAIEHAVGARERSGQCLCDCAGLAVEPLAIAREELDVVAVDPRDRTEPVPLDLERPAVAERDPRRCRGEHWGVDGRVVCHGLGRLPGRC
jgi:hypothetical protein